MSDGLILKKDAIEELISSVNFKKLDGIVPIITQDLNSNEVLMLAFANKEALRKSLATGKAHYWSRSRKELWQKGSQSGHLQIIKEILLDCDSDTLIFKVIQVKAACHTGYYSCFYRKIGLDGIEIIRERVFDPKLIYKEKK